MTVAEAAQIIGTIHELKVEWVTLRVKVLDIRTVWGRTDAYVEPTEPYTQGASWVSLDRLMSI